MPNPNGASIFIELQNFKAFEEQLNKLDDVLKKINARADTTATVMTGLENAFKVKIPKTGGLVQAATDILAAVREINKVGKFDMNPVVDNIEKLGLAFAALPNVTKTQQTAIQNYRLILFNLNAVFNELKLMDFKNVQSRLNSLETAFRNTNNALNVLPKVTSAKTQAILQVDAFFKIVAGVLKRLTNDLSPTDIQNSTKAFAAIGKMLTAVDALAKQVSTLSGGNKSVVFNIVNRDLPNFFKGLKRSAEEMVNLFSVFQRIQRPQAITEIGRLFGRTGFLIEQVTVASAQFGKLDESNLKKLQSFFKNLRPLAKELQQSLNVLSAIERPRSLSGAAQGILGITRILETLRKISINDAELNGNLLNARGPLLRLLRGMKPFTLILGEALNGLNVVQKGTTTVRSVGLIATGLSQLIKVLRDVRAESAEIDRLIVFRRALTKYLRGIRPFFNILADAFDALDKVRAPDNIRYVGRLTDALGELIGQLREIEPQNDVAQIILPGRRLTKFLRGIRPFFAILSDAFDSLSKIKSPDNLRASGRLIDGLGEFIRQISTGFGEQAQLGRFTLPGRRLTRFIVGIRPFFAILSDAFSELDRIKSPENLKAVGNLLQGLQEIINEFRSIPDQNPVYQLILPGRRLTKFLRGIRPFMRILADAFSELDKIKSPENIRAVGTALQALGAFIDQLRIVEANQGILRRVFGGSTQLTKYLRGIRPFAKILGEAIGELANFKGDAAKLAGVSQSLVALSRLLEVIGKLDFSKSVKADVRKNVIPIIREMVKALVDVSKRVKDADKAVKVAEALNKLGNALAAFNKARGFGSTAEELSKGLRDIFNAVNAASKSSGFAKGFATEGETGAKGFLSSIKRILRIASPSRALIEIGQNALAGFVAGFAVSKLLDFGKQAIGFFLSGIKSGFGSLAEFFRGVPAQLGQLFSSAGQSFKAIGASIFQNSLQAVTQGGIKGFIGSASVDLAAGFDQLLNQIKVFGKISTEQLSGVQNAILKFSADTIFDPTESAEAFLNLQKAGLDVAKSLAALPEIGNLAAAGNIKLADATTLALGALNSFGLQANELRRVVDSFAKGADISSAEVTDFGQALGFVGGAARQLKIPIEDMTAAIALLNDQNIRGERAGTGLRAILDSIVAPSDEASKTLDNLGIILQDAEGKFVGLQSVIFQFRNAIARLRAQGFGDVDIVGMLGSLGDRNAIETLFGLIKDGTGTMLEFEDGSKRAAIGFEEYQEKLKTANDAQTTATAMMDTFRGQLESLKGSFQTLLIKGLIPVLKGLKPIIGIGIKFLNFLSSLPQPILSSVAAMFAFGAAATTIIGAIGTLIGVGTILVGGVFSAIATTITTLSALLFTPLGLIAGFVALAGVITAIAGGIVIFTGLAAAGAVAYKIFRDIKNNTDGLRDSVESLFDSLKALGESIFPLISSVTDFVGVMFGASDGVDQFNNSTSEGGNAFKNFVDAIRRQVDRLTVAFNEAKIFFDFFTAVSTDDFSKFEKDYADTADKIVESTDKITAATSFGRDKSTGNQQQQRGTADYLIKSGDTLIGIAAQYGVTVEELIAANDLVKASTGRFIIRAGANLKIPGQVADATAEGAGKVAAAFGQASDDADEAGKRVGSLGKALLVFSKTKIFKRLFGDIDEGAFQKALDFTVQLEHAFRRIKLSGERAFGGIGRILQGDFREGLNDIEVGLAGISAELIDLFETITGIDISAGIEKQLRAGNLVGAVKTVVQPIIDTIRDFLIDHIDEAISYMLKFAFRRFLFPLKLLETLGVPFVKEINDALDGTFNVIGDIVQQLFKLTQGGVSFGSAISSVFAGLGDTLRINGLGGVTDAFDAINNAATKLYDSISKFLKPALDDVSKFLSGVSERSGPAFDRFFSRINPSIKKLGDAFNKLLKAFGRLARGHEAELIQLAIAPIAYAALATATAIGVLVGVIEGIANAVEPTIETLDNFKRVFDEIVEGVKTGDFSGLTDALSDTLSSLTDIFDSFFSGFASGVLDVGQLFADLLGVDVDVKAEASRIANDVKDAINDALSEIGATTSDLFDSGKNAINDFIDGLNDFIPDDVKQVGKDIVSGIGEGIGDLFEEGKNLFKDLLDGVKDFLGIKSPSRKFAEIGEAIVDGLEVGLSDLLTTLQRVFFNIICCPSEFAQDLLGFVRRIFIEGTNLLAKTDIADFASGIANRVISAIKAVPGLLLFALNTQIEVASSIVSFLSGAVKRVTDSLSGGGPDIDFSKIASTLKDGILGALDGLVIDPSEVVNVGKKLIKSLGLEDIDFGTIDLSGLANDIKDGILGALDGLTIDPGEAADVGGKIVGLLGLDDVDFGDIDFSSIFDGLFESMSDYFESYIVPTKFVFDVGKKLTDFVGLTGGDNKDDGPSQQELVQQAEQQAQSDAAAYQNAYVNTILNQAFSGQLGVDTAGAVAGAISQANGKDDIQAAIDASLAQVTDFKAKVQLTELQFVVDANGEGLKTNVSDLITNLGLEPQTALPLDQLLNFSTDATPDEEQQAAIQSSLTSFLESAVAQGLSQEEIATIVSEFDLATPLTNEILSQFGVDADTLAGLKQAGQDVVGSVAQGMTTPQSLAQVDLSTKTVSAKFKAALEKGLEIFEGITGSSYTKRIGVALMISLGDGMEEEFSYIEDEIDSLYEVIDDKFDDVFDFSGGRSYYFYRMGENFIRSMADGMQNALYLLDTPLNNIVTRFQTFQQRISASLLLLRGDMARFSTEAIFQMNRMLPTLNNLEIQFLDLNRAIGLAAINLRLFGIAVQQTDQPISELVANMVAASLQGGAGGGTTGIPGRAYGGDVERGVLYEINEALKGVNRTEVFSTRSGKQYLLPGESGRVTPLADSSGGSGGGTTVVYQNDINVSIGGSNATPEQIAAAVQSGVDEAQAQGFRYRAIKTGRI